MPTADALQVEFSLKGLASVLRGFDKIEKAASRTASAVGTLGSGPGAVGPGRVGGGMRAGGNGPQYVSGPNQRFAMLQRQMASALKDGNKLAEKDIRLSIDRTEKQLNRLKKPEFSKKLQSFISTSRFSSEGFQPLVGRAAALLPEGAAGVAGPVAAILAGLVEVSKALLNFADKTSSITNKFTDTKLSTGATNKEAGQIDLLSKITGGNAGQEALNFYNKTRLGSGDPIATLEAQRLGINTQPEQFGGPTDAVPGYLAAIKAVRAVKDPGEAKRLADRLQASDAMRYYAMSESKYQQSLATGAYNGERLGNPSARTAAADYAANQGAYDQNVERLQAQYGQGNQSTVGSLSNGVVNILQNRNPDDNGDGKPAAPTFVSPTYMPGASGQKLQVSYASASHKAQLVAARHAALAETSAPKDEHTQALKANTEALKKSQSVVAYGQFGNGSRGAAWGSNMDGLALHKAQADKEAFQLGAF